MNHDRSLTKIEFEQTFSLEHLRILHGGNVGNEVGIYKLLLLRLISL